jgi:hypothetical protein
VKGFVAWEGPSRFTGAPIAAIVTGTTTRGSENRKTGPMLQAWVLLQDESPMAAKRQNHDDAVCGSCALRGRDGINSACFVTPWQSPKAVYDSYKLGQYPRLGPDGQQRMVAGRQMRVTAYGDPAAVPTPVWVSLLTTLTGWVGYTHAWRAADPELRWLVMASAHTAADAIAADAAGWRVFRTRRDTDDRLTLRGGLEVICPASHEAGFSTTCQKCQLCRGRSRAARSITILAHGKPGNIAAFYRLTPDGLMPDA